MYKDLWRVRPYIYMDMRSNPPEDNHPKRTGGAGSLSHPLCDEDYRRQMKKIQMMAAAPIDD